jgi:hypothetical protein
MGGMSAIAIVSAYFAFPTDILTTADKRVDWIGAALVTVGLVCIQFSVSAGETAPHGWATGCKCSRDSGLLKLTSTRYYRSLDPWRHSRCLLLLLGESRYE